MSTKIYNAYLYSGNMEQLLVLLQDFREEWLKACLQAFLRLIRDDFERRRSNPEQVKLYENDKELMLDSAKKITDKIREETAKKYNLIFDFYDIKAAASIYVYDGKIVLHFFADPCLDETRALFEEFLETNDKCLTDYHYQDQADPYYAFDDDLTDEEKDVLEKEYEERGRFYDEIFKRDSAPINAGFQYVISSEGFDDHVIVSRIFEKLRETGEID